MQNVRRCSGDGRPGSAWRQNGHDSQNAVDDEGWQKVKSSGPRRAGNRPRHGQFGGSWRNQKGQQGYHPPNPRTFQPQQPVNQRGARTWGQEARRNEPSKPQIQVRPAPPAAPKPAPAPVLNLRPQRPGTAWQRPPLAPKAHPPKPGMPAPKTSAPTPPTRAGAGIAGTLKGPPAFLLAGDAYSRRQAQVPSKHSWLALMDLEEEHGWDFTHDHMAPWVMEPVAKEYARSGLLAAWAKRGAVFRSPFNRLV